MSNYGVTAWRTDAPACGATANDGHWQTDFLAEGIDPSWVDAHLLVGARA